MLRGHVREVSAIAYDPSGSRLASAGPDGSFRIGMSNTAERS